MIPARWRVMIAADQSHRTSYYCEGDGLDSCRAPASWVAERVDAQGRVLAIVANRCPDHIPVRALQALSPPSPSSSPREAIRSAMTAPPEPAPTEPHVGNVKGIKIE